MSLYTKLYTNTSVNTMTTTSSSTTDTTWYPVTVSTAVSRLFRPKGPEREPAIKTGPVLVTGNVLALEGRRGECAGFVQAGECRVCLVEWPGGGVSWLAEEMLSQAPGPSQKLQKP